MKAYRVNVSIRAKAKAPFDQIEIKSEDYDSYEDYAMAVADFVIDNINADLDADDEGDDDATDLD